MARRGPQRGQERLPGFPAPAGLTSARHHVREANRPVLGPERAPGDLSALRPNPAGAGPISTPVAEVTGWGTHDVAKETTRVGDILNAKRMRREHPFMVEDVKVHGVREPIYQDPDTGKLWDGHHRVAAALDAGLTHVPVLKKRRPV